MTEEDKLASAKRQGQAQFDSIKEMVEALGGWQAAAVEAGWKPYLDKFNVPCWQLPDIHNDDTVVIERGATFAGTAQELCKEHGIEPTSNQEEAARQTIEEDALSVQVRSGWFSPGEKPEAEEYEILLCTGGPAVRIIGQLDRFSEPESARMEVQDWFQPWTEFRPQVGPDNYNAEPIMLEYARVFYFG